MSGLNGIMDSSLSALLAAQLGMATTGHNIANAGTEGYSRQDMILSCLLHQGPRRKKAF